MGSACDQLQARGSPGRRRSLPPAHRWNRSPGRLFASSCLFYRSVLRPACCSMASLLKVSAVMLHVVYGQWKGVFLADSLLPPKLPRDFFVLPLSSPPSLLPCHRTLIHLTTNREHCCCCCCYHIYSRCKDAERRATALRPASCCCCCCDGPIQRRRAKIAGSTARACPRYSHSANRTTHSAQAPSVQRQPVDSRSAAATISEDCPARNPRLAVCEAAIWALLARR